MRIYIAGNEKAYKAIEGKNIYPSWHTVGGLKFLDPNHDFLFSSNDCIVLFSSVFKDKEHLLKYVLNLRNCFKGSYIIVIAKKEYEEDMSFTHAMQRANAIMKYCNKINADQLLELMPNPKPKIKPRIVYQEPEPEPIKQPPKQKYIKDTFLTRMAIRFIERKAVLSEGHEP